MFFSFSTMESVYYLIMTVARILIHFVPQDFMSDGLEFSLFYAFS